MAQTPLPASSTNRPNSPRSPHLCSGPSASTPSSSLPPAAPALLFAGHCFPVLPPAHVTWLASQWRTHSVGSGSALGCSWSSSLPLVGTGSHRPTPSRLPGLARSEQGLRPRPHQRLWPCEAVGLWGPPQGAAAALTSPTDARTSSVAGFCCADRRWHPGPARLCAPTGLPCWFLLGGCPTPVTLTGDRQQAVLTLPRAETPVAPSRSAGRQGLAGLTGAQSRNESTS